MTIAASALVVVRIAIARVRATWRDQSVVIGTLLFATVALASAAVGARDYASRVERFAQLRQQLARSQAESQKYLLGWSTEPALRALRPPSVGLVLARGRDPVMPLYVDFSPSGTLETRTPAAETGVGDLGSIGDVEMLLRLIGGLFAIAFGMQATMHAKQSGWLRMLMGLPVRSWQVIVGLWIGCSAVIGSAAILCLGASLAVAMISAGNTDGLTAAALRALPSWLLYLSTMTAAGIALSAWVAQPLRASGAALTFWLVFVWLGPQFSSAIGQLLRPSMPRLTLEAEREEEFAAAVRAGESALGTVLAARGPKNQAELDHLVLTMHDELDAVWRPLAGARRQRALQRDAEWIRQRERQEQLITSLSALFPGALVQRAVSDAVGTGAFIQETWRNATDEQQQLYERLLFDDPPRVTIRVRIYAGEGAQIWPFTRRPNQGVLAYPRFEPPAETSGAQQMAVLRTNALLLMQLLIALGAALLARPEQLRPSDQS